MFRLGCSKTGREVCKGRVWDSLSLPDQPAIVVGQALVQVEVHVMEETPVVVVIALGVEDAIDRAARADRVGVCSCLDVLVDYSSSSRVGADG